MVRKKILIIAWATICGCANADAFQDSGDQSVLVTEILQDVISKHELPGIAAAALKNGKLIAAEVAGVRKWGVEDKKITVNDKLHLGSCSKAMTATLVGVLVKQEKMTWSDTIGQRLPGIKDKIDPVYHDMTIWQILTHRAAINSLGPFRLNKGVNTKENRLEIISKGLAKKPDNLEIGQFEYSNLGYIVVAMMAESATGTKWESLIQQELFGPLGMTTAGFGPPSTAGNIDQPWGHGRNSSQIFSNQFDNPPSLAPAGTIHCSIVDWAKFVALHLDLECNNHDLLTPEILKKLHTPADGPGTSYAAGWLVENDPQGSYEIAHEGSNVFWLSTVMAYPGRRAAILVVSNMNPLEANEANHEVIKRIKDLDLWVDSAK